MVARYADKWLSGHQISIYTTGRESVSKLKLPKIGILEYPKKEDAIKASVDSIYMVLTASMVLEPALASVQAINKFHTIYKLKSILEGY